MTATKIAAAGRKRRLPSLPCAKTSQTAIGTASAKPTGRTVPSHDDRRRHQRQPPPRPAGNTERPVHRPRDEESEQRVAERSVLDPDAEAVEEHHPRRDEAEQPTAGDLPHCRVPERRGREPEHVLDEGQQTEMWVELVEDADEERVAGRVVEVGEQSVVGRVDVGARVRDAQEGGLVADHEDEANERPRDEDPGDDRYRPIDAYFSSRFKRRLRYPA